MAQSVIDNLLETIEERLQGARLIDWVAHESPGILVNPTRAEADPVCKCYDIDGKSLCFHVGVIGGLDESQKHTYCKQIISEESPELKERVSKFREASQACVTECSILPKGERLSCRLSCMSRELAQRGIQV